MDVRPEVRAFAAIMERKLRKHDDWPGWKDCDRWWLLDALREHVRKLDGLLFGQDEPARVAEAAADCANYAMMIADVAGGLTPPEPATGPTSRSLRERLAAIEHERWADWQRYMHGMGTRNPDGSLTIPAELVARWDRQIATPYADLSASEQRSDMEQVDRYWPLIEPVLTANDASGA